MTATRKNYAPIWIAGLITLAIAITFGPLVRASFTDWDDQDTIWQNPHMRPATMATLGHYWTHTEGELYIPLTYTVWAGLAKIAPLRGAGGLPSPNPAVFHAANILVHILTVLMVF